MSKIFSLFLVESKKPSDPIAFRWAENMDQEETEYLEELKQHADTIECASRFIGEENEVSLFLRRLYREGIILRDHIGLLALMFSDPDNLINEAILDSEKNLQNRLFVKNEEKERQLDELNYALDQIDWQGEVYILNSEGVHYKFENDQLVKETEPLDYDDPEELARAVKIDQSTSVAFITPLEWREGNPRVAGPYQHRLLGTISLSGQFEEFACIIDPRHPARSSEN
jgi:hypothetical protein